MIRRWAGEAGLVVILGLIVQVLFGSYPRTERSRIARRREYERMIEQLESGVPPNQIRGDSDVLVAALETVRRRADEADDLHGEPTILSDGTWRSV